jgi:hypothetical protein
MGRRRLASSIAVEDHLRSGRPLSSLEALLIYGWADLTAQVTKFRKAGLPLAKRKIKLADVVARAAALAGGPVTLAKSAPASLLVTEFVVDKAARNAMPASRAAAQAVAKAAPAKLPPLKRATAKRLAKARAKRATKRQAAEWAAAERET